EVAHRHFAFAFKVWRSRFEAHNMRLLQLQFRGILASDDALVAVDVVRQAIKQRRLARTRAARDDDIATHASDDLEDFRALGAYRTELDQLVESQLVLFELTDGQYSAVNCQWWCNDVDTRAIWKTRVADWR